MTGSEFIEKHLHTLPPELEALRIEVHVTSELEPSNHRGALAALVIAKLGGTREGEIPLNHGTAIGLFRPRPDQTAAQKGWDWTWDRIEAQKKSDKEG
jgi:hypothetical protein